ncbi:MAG: hypothetical protein ACXVNF_00270 [Neobacillus sp.]
MANYFWQQSYLDSVYGTLLPVMGYLFYFYLMEKSVDVKIIERIIRVIGLALTVLYLFCFSIYPIKVLEYKESTDREFLRLFLFGDGFLFLFYFLAINRFLTSKSWLWFILAMAACLCVILNQTRVYMVAVAAITVWYFIRSKGFVLRIASVAVIVTAFLILPQLDYIKGLQSKTQSDLGSSDEYIRIKAAKYYLNKFQPSPVTRVFGNGFPNGKDSYYSHEISLLQTDRGFYAQDIGLAGLYAYLGIFAVIAFVIIYYKGLKAKLADKYNYLKMFLLFLITTSFTTDSTFSGSYVFAIVFTLYLYEHCTEEAQKTFVTIPIYKLPELK